jgi:hypothetical protein
LFLDHVSSSYLKSFSSLFFFSLISCLFQTAYTPLLFLSGPYNKGIVSRELFLMSFIFYHRLISFLKANLQYKLLFDLQLAADFGRGNLHTVWCLVLRWNLLVKVSSAFALASFQFFRNRIFPFVPRFTI